MSRSDSQRLVSRRSWSPSRRDYLRRAAVSLRRRRRSSLCLRRLGLLGRSSIRRVSEEAAGPPRFLRCLFRNVSMAKGPGGIAASLPNAAHDDVAFRSAQVRQLPQMYISGRTHQPAPSLSTLRRRGHPRQRKTRYRSAGLSLDRAELSPARHQSLISEFHRFSFLQGQACPGALCTSTTTRSSQPRSRSTRRALTLLDRAARESDPNAAWKLIHLPPTGRGSSERSTRGYRERST